jgi:Flp pilus assembly protein TadG
MRRGRGDGAAALVEFAIILPVFFLLVFGIMEFGYAFFQQLDVRHGAREGARLAAVNYKTTANPTPADQATQIVNELCDRMDSGTNISVRLRQDGTAAVGQEFTVTVTKPLQQLTGFLNFALGGKTLSSTVDSRIEQTASWASMSTAQACP